MDSITHPAAKPQNAQGIPQAPCECSPSYNIVEQLFQIYRQLHQTHTPMVVLGFLLAAMPLNQAFAQRASTQTIRGIVRDADTQQPLPGASVVLFPADGTTDELTGASSDLDGHFRLEGVALGRRHLSVSFIGYEPISMPNLLVTAGKEVVLELALTESVAQLETVTVKADDDQGRPLNEMATVSARSFDVEETGRYAAGIFDPARMALNFAGVAGSDDDLSNEIIVRGNSSRGLLWRLEGVEIPNPNHFGGLGGGGGAISMLSSSTLSRSDFYTGAFPAEFGNATSGVFDLRLREGNSEQREYSFMAGLLGIEASAEGPFSAGSNASYLINYRYSTLALLSTFMQPVGDILPTYQDLSFKVHMPTKNAGSFSLWGLGGANTASEEVQADSAQWEGRGDAYGFDDHSQMGVVGLSHRYLLGNRTWMRTVLAASTDRYWDKYYYLDEEQDYATVYYDSTRFRANTFRANWMLHHKVNAAHSIRGGLIYGHQDYFYEYQNADSNGVWTRYLYGEGQTGLAQAHAQWRYRFHPNWTLQSGVHGTLLRINNAWSVDPRLSIEWQENDARRWTLAFGQHSKPEHLSSYYLEQANPDEGIQASINQDLELTKAVHGVLGLSQSLGGPWRLNVEAYGQYLYDVAIDADSGSTGSILNARDIWEIVGVDSAVSDGVGYNIGLDLTVERAFQNGWYGMFTGSVFRSRYRPNDGNWYSTAYDRGYTANILGGKEWPVGKKGNKTLGLNGKFALQGGNRYDAIDLEASRAAGETVLVPGGDWSAQTPVYYRLDWGFQYRIERPKATHMLRLDVQNTSNRQNLFTEYYDADTGNLEGATQTGVFPFLNYRISF